MTKPTKPEVLKLHPWEALEYVRNMRGLGTGWPGRIGRTPHLRRSESCGGGNQKMLKLSNEIEVASG